MEKPNLFVFWHIKNGWKSNSLAFPIITYKRAKHYPRAKYMQPVYTWEHRYQQHIKFILKSINNMEKKNGIFFNVSNKCRVVMCIQGKNRGREKHRTTVNDDLNYEIFIRWCYSKSFTFWDARLRVFGFFILKSHVTNHCIYCENISYRIWVVGLVLRAVYFHTCTQKSIKRSFVIS